jgi:hypothetical protein
MINDFATIDFETFYDKDYSLSKMQTDAYILGEQFEIIGVGVKPSRDAEIEWFSGTEAETKRYLAQAFDWKNTAVCCHNTMFDGFICTQRLGLKPKLWMDTLAMGRAAYSWLPSHSLANLAKHVGIGQKGSEVLNALGLHRADFPADQLERYADYCRMDVALTDTLARVLLETTSPLELKIIDMTVRMFTEPSLQLNKARLQDYYDAEIVRKEQLLEKTEADKDVLMSNDKLAMALVELGVVPPKKVSKRTGKEAYAFAKSDKAFTALLEHPESEVQALVAARLGVKTTIAETRAQRLIETAERGRGFPIYLNYWGAKTTGRLSGGNGINAQNIPNRGADRVIREAIIAPHGHKVVVGDSANIELRVAMAAAGQSDVVRKITDGTDLYCDFATKLYGREITAEDKSERMLGKIAMLSLQYGAGHKTFREMVRVQAKKNISEEEAQQIVGLYRELHGHVRKLWSHCENNVLVDIFNREGLRAVDVNGWALTTHTGFAVPGWPGVHYHDLKHNKQEGAWTYQSGKTRPYIYGGKLVENLCQHLARHIVLWQTARVNERFPVALSVHDEIVCVVPDEQVTDCVAYMTESLSLAPKWCRESIPLACEVGVGESYGLAK